MRKLWDTETKNLSSIQAEPRTQQIENEDFRVTLSRSFLPRPPQPGHLRIPKSTWRHVTINKFRISTNSLENTHGQN